MRRRALRAAALGALLVLAGCGASDRAASGTARDADADADGRALPCTGAGRTAVVLEAGLGVDPAATWAAVERGLRPRMRVCMHLRPGTGGLPRRRGPRSAAVAARELHALVRARRLGRIVLVGASFGGLVAQVFAAAHPADVAGIVLVDSLHPALDRTFERIFGRRAASARARALARNAEGVTWGDLRRSAREAAAAAPHVPGVPLVVLEHGVSFDPGGQPVPALERAWTRMQRDLARRSPRGRLVVARRSHHRIAEDEPAVVIRAIRTVVRAARA